MRGYFKSTVSLFSLLNCLHSARPLSTARIDIMSLTRKAELGYHGKTALLIIGVDEAGRGPLAGPVVTAACFIENDVHIDGINDSKQTKEEEREAMYAILTNHPQVHWAATVVSHTEIDEVNILQATMNGMRRSTEALHAKLQKLHPNGAFRALIDGNRVPIDMPVDATYVIKGDSIIFSIAAASIIAKVTRDRLMLELDKEFPVYNFAQHKGYPTFAHRSLLMQHGPCRVHRTSYAPVKLAMAAHGITDLTTLPSPAAAVAAVAVKTAVPKGTAKKASTKATAKATTKSTTKATTKAVEASKVKVAPTKPSKTEKAGSKASIAKKGAKDTRDTTEKVVKAAASAATAVSARAGRRASSQSVDSLASLPGRATRVDPAAQRNNSNGALKNSPSATAKKSTTVSVPKVRRTAKAKDVPSDVVEDSVVGGVGKGKRSKSAPAEVPAEVKEGRKRNAAPALDKKRKAVSEQDGENSAGARKSARLRQ